MKKKFLIAIDGDSHELFILHREWPACLIQVIQTTPATFRIIDLYDEIDHEELLKHPFLEAAKRFWIEAGEKSLDKN